MDRRQLFEFQKERIEHAYAESINFGSDRVVIAADTTDDNANLFLRNFLTDHQLENLSKDATDLAPTLSFAIQNEESFKQIVRQFFPRIAGNLATELVDTEYFVLILSGGNCSLTVHSKPD